MDIAAIAAIALVGASLDTAAAFSPVSIQSLHHRAAVSVGGNPFGPSLPTQQQTSVESLVSLHAKKKQRRRRNKPKNDLKEDEEIRMVDFESVLPPPVKKQEEAPQTEEEEEAPKPKAATPEPMAQPIQSNDGPIAPKGIEEELPGIQSAIPVPTMSEESLKKQMEADLALLNRGKKKRKRLIATPYDDDEDLEKDKANRIDRKDTDAFMRLLEQQPYADADDSLFEEEEYTIVNALLGERAKSFLAIPSGPLQVGHFIGALVIILMAFVEYPGFPLTNLPTQLRGALQGGLATVYFVNALIAVVSVFKAKERGQPVSLWIVKCFTVGGIAYDQLTQIPTLEEVEEARNRKGKRALKNRKK